MTTARGVVTGGHQVESLQPEPRQNALWLKMFVQKFESDFADFAYIADSIGFERRSGESSTSAQGPSPFVLLQKERESDAAMGSPMRLLQNENGFVKNGVQFRNGFGALWADTSKFANPQFHFCSSSHRAVSEDNPESLRAFAGQ